MKKSIKYIALLALGLVSCELEFENPIDQENDYTSGEADFSNFVSLGNSLTAGFADSALYLSGQQNSYPNILSQQFAFAGGGSFTQPLMADNTGGALLGGTQVLPNRLVLAFDENQNPGPSVYTGAAPTTEISNVLTGPFNNMGVAGAKSYHLVAPGYGDVAGVATGTANPYFVRMASTPSATMLDDTVAQNPSFFSLWIGNNDILSYATGGGVGVDHNETGNTSPSTYASNDITNAGAFAFTYNSILAALTANGAKGIVVDLPDVSSLPYFTTVPYTPLVPIDENGETTDFGLQVPTLNAVYGALSQAFAFAGVPERAIQFSATMPNPVVILDEALTNVTADLTTALTPTYGPLAPVIAAQFGQARFATADDLLVLPSRSVIGQVDADVFAQYLGFGLSEADAAQFSVRGVSFPLADQYVLTSDEQNKVKAATSAYNATIKALAAQYELAFYSAAADLKIIAAGGIAFDGGILTSDYVTGGAFSLDGVHPTPRGYAYTANRMLDVIEAKYGTKVPRVAVGDFGTVTLSNEVN